MISRETAGGSLPAPAYPDSRTRQMSLQPQPTHEEAREVDTLDTGATHPGAAVEETGAISIELNFNAFADDVPPDRHARRRPHLGDPSIQDFADQVLELAALRAELKRLSRDYEIAQQQIRIRDARLDALRRELASATTQLRHAMQRIGELPNVETADVEQDDPAEKQQAAGAEARARPELTATLDIPQENAEVPAAANSRHASLPSAPRRPELIPLDQDDDQPISLIRTIVTVGRTRDHDICIPSRAVSRDHARLLVMKNSVTVVDMGSANGCFINNERVERQKLRDGDVLRIADRSFRFVSHAD